MLQWGRVLMNAETHSAGRQVDEAVLASMGPRSHERGNQGVRIGATASRLASMGPRSHERGNSDNIQGARSIGPLQWGRVLMNAETTSFGRLFGFGPGGLQWGRVLMNAETGSGYAGSGY